MDDGRRGDAERRILAGVRSGAAAWSLAPRPAGVAEALPPLPPAIPMAQPPLPQPVESESRTVEAGGTTNAPLVTAEMWLGLFRSRSGEPAGVLPTVGVIPFGFVPPAPPPPPPRTNR